MLVPHLDFHPIGSRPRGRCKIKRRFIWKDKLELGWKVAAFASISSFSVVRLFIVTEASVLRYPWRYLIKKVTRRIMLHIVIYSTSNIGAHQGRLNLANLHLKCLWVHTHCTVCSIEASCGPMLQHTLWAIIRMWSVSHHFNVNLGVHIVDWICFRKLLDCIILTLRHYCDLLLTLFRIVFQ